MTPPTVQSPPLTPPDTRAQALNEKTFRIALLFREATVLDEPHWEEFIRRSGFKAEKGAWEVLNQDVSLRAFSELLRMDVLTLRVTTRHPSEISAALSAPVRISPPEIGHILKRNQPDVARLCHFLISHNLLTTQALEAALDEAEANALNVYDVLVSRGIVSPEVLEKATRDRMNDVAQDNRALLAGDILIFNSMITRDDFSRALESRAVTRAPLSRTFEQLRIITQPELLDALFKGIELPMVELLAYDVAPDLLERFPEEFMRQHLFLPLSVQDSYFELGTADPFNLTLADTISLLTGRRVSMIYSPHSDLLAKFRTLYPPEPSTAMTAMPQVTVPRAGRPAAQTGAGAERNGSGNSSNGGSAGGDAAARVPDYDATRQRFEPFVDNLTTVQLVTQIVESAVTAKATDIHIEPQVEDVRVRYRVDGILHSVMRVPAEMQLSVISRIKVLAGMNVTERRRPQDGHFSLTTRTGNYDFRVSTMPSAHGENVVLRVLDSTRVLTGLEQLGLDKQQQDTLERLVARPYGLILVTGPTGSGKTSTLYACVSTVNQEAVNILTIEDPVEYQLDGITQVQVDNNIDLSFAAGLRAALRQDPDVIMVGEIRDPETAAIAIRAALTGHLVFSTLHTNTAVGAVSALGHMGIQNYLLASALSGIVAQRLVRCVCGECRKAFAPGKQMLKDLGLASMPRGKKFYKGTGCDACFGTGYSGRTGIFEVVELTEVLRRAVADGASEQELTDMAAALGPTLMASGIRKAYEGITSPAEVLEAVTLS